ncbi:MAG: metal ABC transporter solute-binding protein, Zn/Mn family [Candidatus Woesearchaeota archaeon]
MKNTYVFMIFIFIISIISLTILTSCSQQTINNNIQNEKLSIVTTLYPLYEFSKEVGGDKVDVTLLLSPGTEAHTFEPRPSDITKIASADIFIYTGSGIEPWAHDILEGVKNPNRIDLDTSKFVELLKTIEHYEEEYTNETETHEDDVHGEYDPHFWLDFSQDTKVVDAIAEAYIRKDPTNKEYYLSNAQNYKQKLVALDNSYKTGLGSCKQNEFITGGHNAYTYLGNRYGIEFVSVYGVSPDSEPTPKAIKEIADIAAIHNIKYILVEELVSPRMAEAIANDAKAEILVFNPGHNLLKSEFDNGVTFISLMEANLINLKIALECN